MYGFKKGREGKRHLACCRLGKSDRKSCCVKIRRPLEKKNKKSDRRAVHSALKQPLQNLHTEEDFVIPFLFAEGYSKTEPLVQRAKAGRPLPLKKEVWPRVKRESPGRKKAPGVLKERVRKMGAAIAVIGTASVMMLVYLICMLFGGDKK